MRCALSLLLAAWVLLFDARTASAHAIGLSRGDYRRTPKGVEVELVFARGDVLAALPSLDEDHDGYLDAAELRRGSEALTALTLQGLTVSQPDRACAGHAGPPELTEADGLRARTSFLCESGARPISVDLGFLRSMAHGHRHHAQLSNGALHSEAIYFGSSAHFELEPWHEPVRTEAPTRALEKLGYLRMGFEHILTGADHIAFLLALVLGTSRPLGLLRVVTAFTLSHSLSLAVVALGWFAPNPGWVEPAIALSVAYVGFENLCSAQPKRRELVSFAFGLLHGLGFGGALSEISLARSEIPSALALFNVGVELGQLSLIFSLLPLLAWARKADRLPRRALPACSLGLAACGLIWFAARLA